jgi:hypothetical protein
MRDATMKRKLIIVKALEAVAMPLIVFLLVHPSEPISRATYERIQRGMTKAEVDAIIGFPPSDDLLKAFAGCDLAKATGDDGLVWPTLVGDYGGIRAWSYDSGLLIVAVSVDDKVFGKVFIPRRPAHRLWLDELTAWLGF